MGAYKDTFTCPSCGYRINRSKGDYDDYCPKCGEYLEDYEEERFSFEDDMSFDDSDYGENYRYKGDYD